MKEISKVVYKKQGRKWVETYRTNDTETVYKDLSSALIWHFIYQSNYTSKIVRKNNYDGTVDITVYYTNGFKYVYTVQD